MASIFADGFDRFAQRIEALTPDSPRQWGKMNCAQMLSHCSYPFRIATGEVAGRRALIGRLFGALAKKVALGPKPFKANMPTGPEFRRRGEHDFVTEKDQLMAGLRRFHELGPDGVSKDPHPFFGSMSADDWDRLMTKHLDHHLRQFSA